MLARYLHYRLLCYGKTMYEVGVRFLMAIANILLHVILPIMILIGIGLLLHRSFQLEMNTLSKLLFYYYIPALTFVKIYESNASATLIFSVFGFLLIQFVAMYLLSRLISFFFNP